MPIARSIQVIGAALVLGTFLFVYFGGTSDLVPGLLPFGATLFIVATAVRGRTPGKRFQNALLALLVIPVLFALIGLLAKALLTKPSPADGRQLHVHVDKQ